MWVGNRCSLQPPGASPEVESTGLMLHTYAWHRADAPHTRLAKAPPWDPEPGSQSRMRSVPWTQGPICVGTLPLTTPLPVTRHFGFIRQGPKNPPLPAPEALLLVFTGAAGPSPSVSFLDSTTVCSGQQSPRLDSPT